MRNKHLPHKELPYESVEQWFIINDLTRSEEGFHEFDEAGLMYLEGAIALLKQARLSAQKS
jgi:hypothetical protein